MKQRLNKILDTINEEFGDVIQKGSRHYCEISIGNQAAKLGYDDLKEKFKHTYAVIPLRSPQRGMKVRIDGRTFVSYAEYESGIVVPGFLAKQADRPYVSFVPNHSMICNFV